jgi:hypothetical protein
MNRGWEEGVGGLQFAIFIVMSMERSAIRTTLGRSRSASVGPEEPVQLQHCTATGRGRAKSGRPPLGLSCAPRAPLGTRNLVRILEYSSDRPTTWNLASGKSPPSFGSPWSRVCPTLFPIFPRGEHSPPRYSRRRNPVCHSASDSPPRPPPCSPTRRDRGTEPTSRAASPSAPPRRRPSASHLALSVLCVLVPVPNQPPPQPSPVLSALYISIYTDTTSAGNQVSSPLRVPVKFLLPASVFPSLSRSCRFDLQREDSGRHLWNRDPRRHLHPVSFLNLWVLRFTHPRLRLSRVWAFSWINDFWNFWMALLLPSTAYRIMWRTWRRDTISNSDNNSTKYYCTWYLSLGIWGLHSCRNQICHTSFCCRSHNWMDEIGSKPVLLPCKDKHWHFFTFCFEYASTSLFLR